MVGAGRHAGLRRHTRAISLVALHIALIGQGLLGIHGDIGGHVSSRPHVRVLGDAWAAGLRWEMAWGLLGRVDLVTAVYPILAARRRLGCIEARLSSKKNQYRVRKGGREEAGNKTACEAYSPTHASAHMEKETEGSYRRGVVAYLDKVLPFRLGDEGLELGGGESIDKARLGHDKQQNLSARQDRQFVCLDAEIQMLAGLRPRIMRESEDWSDASSLRRPTPPRARAPTEATQLVEVRKQAAAAAEACSSLPEWWLQGARGESGKTAALSLCVSRDSGEGWQTQGRAEQSKAKQKTRTFFMIPAFRLEKVMWRRDLSLINLISIFRRSRPPFSSSSSSSSAAARGRLTPRPSLAVPLPTACASSSSVGDVWSCWSVMSAMMDKSCLRVATATATFFFSLIECQLPNPNPNPIVVDLYHTRALEKATSGGDTVLSVVPMDLYWIWRFFFFLKRAERDRREGEQK